MIQTRQLTCMLSLFVLPTLLDSFSPVSLRHKRCGDIAAQTSTEFGAKTMPEVEIVSEMPPPMPTDLKNHYYLLRHGQSTANVAGIISSSRSLAYSDKHGLTELGYQQGKSSANDLVSLIKQQSKPGDQIIFVSSPFARARQTAQACLDGLEESYLDELNDLDLNLSTDIQMEDRLMERYFGKLDGEAIYTYAYVWPVDKFNTTHTAFETESVAAVATRLRRIVEDHESKYRNSHIIWTSHADVLQIAQVYAADYDNVGSFSSFRFGNGEVRAVKHGADTLPDAMPLQPLDRTI
jgi:broad specificity phosphatase PhoE